MKISRIAIVSAALLFSVIFALPAFSAMGSIDRFALSGTVDRDLAGAGGAIGADGKPDAEFFVSIRGRAGSIAGFSLKNLTNGQEWATSGAQDVLVVVDSSGATVNSSFPMVAFLLMADFRIYANDREAIMAVGGEFELTARFLDNSTATARTTIEPVAPAPEQVQEEAEETEESRRRRDRGDRDRESDAPAAQTPAGVARVISSSFLGKGNFDLTNETKRLASNVNPDYRIDVSLAGSDTLTGVRIRAVSGTERIWDTVPTTGNPLIAVAERGSGTALNARDGSISIPIRELRDLTFWFDGPDEVARQNFRVTLLYTGGRVEEIDITQTAAAPPAPAETETRPQRGGGRRSVSMVAKPVQIRLDVVGRDREKKISGTNDFSLWISVRGEGTITAVSVRNELGNGRWDTIPRSTSWLTIVRRDNAQVNSPSDFSVSIPISGNDNRLELLMETDGTLANNAGRLLLSLTWSDGEVTEEFLSW